MLYITAFKYSINTRPLGNIFTPIFSWYINGLVSRIFFQTRATRITLERIYRSGEKYSKMFYLMSFINLRPYIYTSILNLIFCMLIYVFLCLCCLLVCQCADYQGGFTSCCEYKQKAARAVEVIQLFCRMICCVTELV